MSGHQRPVLFRFRRDLRLADHLGMHAALESGAPVIPLFIFDRATETLGAAAKWRLGLGLDALQRRLREIGSDLILRRGEPVVVLRALARETGASEIHVSRYYLRATLADDKSLRELLAADGIDYVDHPGFLLHEPWTIRTGSGDHYQVYTPFWRNVAQRDIPAPLPAITHLPAPTRWPTSELLADWRLGAAMQRGADVVARHVRAGEDVAHERRAAFADGPLRDYAQARDRPDLHGTSRLSTHLTLGEISPRSVWHAARQAQEPGTSGAETFLKELVWREFAWHLAWHTPQLLDANWRPDWDRFPWRDDNEDAERWRRGLTGEPIIDAGLRELYVTGTMHNRVRMLVASYLTKHLMTHWRIGQAWFADCLIDWDPAANALGWQWTAGSGPDASPFFRIFNPATQAEKFDPQGAYRRRFLAGWGDGEAHADALAYFDAVPRSWGLSAGDAYPEAMVDLKVGRERALEAYQWMKSG